MSASLDEQVRAYARRLGFDAVAVARADLPLDEEMERYERFLDDGMHGEMRYLAEHREARRRIDTDAVLRGARSVVCLARRYPKDGDLEGIAPHLARYARGRDYHNFLRKKLRRLAAFLRTLPSPDGAKVAARPLCDDVPVLERAWAARAGLGFIGKNGLLIVPGQGSFSLLGEVVTTLPLAPDSPLPGRCGACRLCLDACPTAAFPEPFVLDARRCVAYLTIELRGPIPAEHRTGIGEHLFGCDDCQTVCPFNASEREPPAGSSPFAPTESVRGADLERLLTPDGVASALPPGSPLLRAGPEGLARNAAIVLGNRRRATSSLPASRRALEVAAEGHASEVVREAARWALGPMKP